MAEQAQAFKTPNELAKRWKVSIRHVHNLLRRQELQHVRIGDCIRVPADEVLAFEQRPPKLNPARQAAAKNRRPKHKKNPAESDA